MARISAIILSIGLMVGLLGSGYFIEQGIMRAKNADHYVSVKGLAEKQVKADLAIWEVDYREVGSNLVDMSARIVQDQQKVVQFLNQNGFDNSEIQVLSSKVDDRLANNYGDTSAQQGQANRYIITNGVRIRSKKVDQVQRTRQLTDELIKLGVPVAFNTDSYSSDLSSNPSYLFTGLDNIRPEMLAMSTQSARLVAQQFAKDSHSQLGDIRRASQGVFQIMGSDATDNNGSSNEASSINKKVRLVTSIDYFLRSSTPTN